MMKPGLLRKLTTQRNNSLHYGSDSGAGMAVTYHSVIGTVKLHGCSIWNFIGTFFKNIFKKVCFSNPVLSGLPVSAGFPFSFPSEIFRGHIIALHAIHPFLS